MLLGACATRPDPADRDAVAEYEANNDPLEPANRVSYEVNDAIDRAVLEPAARGYRAVVPPPVRTGIGNVLANLRSPVTLVNDLLQGEGERARITLGRFMVNTVLGIGGVLDLGTTWGVPGHTEDFGQTLAVWGVGEGPYLFIPLLGSSNPRDLTGTVVGIASDPFAYLGQGAVVDALSWTRVGLTVLDTREGLIETVDALRQNSLDPYATVRSAYRQRRASQIRNDDSGPASQADRASGLGRGLGIQPR
jgi:phospholipid-binding lipoprotein MlaA